MAQQRDRCLHLLHVLREELLADEKRQMEWTELVSKLVIMMMMMMMMMIIMINLIIIIIIMIITVMIIMMSLRIMTVISMSMRAAGG
jgi:uncharacterized membrane protein